LFTALKAGTMAWTKVAARICELSVRAWTRRRRVWESEKEFLGIVREGGERRQQEDNKKTTRRREERRRFVLVLHYWQLF